MADPIYNRAVWSKVVRPAVLARDGYECQIKGPKCVGVASEPDHIVPWQEGGAWYDMANLRAACKPCNAARRQPVAPGVVERVPSREW